MEKQLPCRGDIWVAYLDPVEGHEQSGRRPCLVLSEDVFNHGPSELVVVLPLTSKKHDIPLRIAIEPPEGETKRNSYIMPEMIRSISSARLLEYWGKIDGNTMRRVEEHVRILLGL
ncbi:MAG TPA: type II toxin-antitoxin system PemK/MazF family toxin [Candidatus Hydrogenedentes bacterium]|nr:type II toxin-antitoxin system PemK/MazF family toxin [Candidatus Hydrogenedentota bacterium]